MESVLKRDACAHRKPLENYKQCVCTIPESCISLSHALRSHAQHTRSRSRLRRQRRRVVVADAPVRTAVRMLIKFNYLILDAAS